MAMRKRCRVEAIVMCLLLFTYNFYSCILTNDNLSSEDVKRSIVLLTETLAESVVNDISDCGG